MKHTINKGFMLICLVFMSLTLLAQNKDLKNISATVIDQNGKPLKDVMIYAKEGATKASTDEKGIFTLMGSLSEVIRIEAKGYETQLINAAELVVKDKSVTLVKAGYQKSEKDIVNLPFGTMLKRNTVGNISFLHSDDVLNEVPGQSNTLDAIAGRIPGVFGTTNLLGLGGATVVVDGIPRSNYFINLQEVDQITVLKDVTSRMLYGTQSDKGVIMVTTKRGTPYQRKMNVYAETSMGIPISYPKYLNSADYMGLYNEALTNDGLPARYTQTQIDKTRQGISPLVDKDAFANENYYTSDYLRNFTNTSKINLDASGGNNAAQYYANIGWETGNSVTKLGEESNARTNKINVRGNVDYKINDFIKAKLDIVSILDIDKGANANFWQYSSTLHPNYFPQIIPTSLLPKILSDQAKVVAGDQVLGGTQNFPNNIYGELNRKGISTMSQYTIQFNAGLDFDLKSITPGLTASVLFSYDTWALSKISQTNAYAVYEPIWTVTSSAKDSLTFKKYNTDDLKGTLAQDSSNTFRRIGSYGKLGYKREFGNHKINATAVFYYDELQQPPATFIQTHLTIGQHINYSFKDKYMIEFDGALVGSGKLSRNDRYKYAPSIGLAWVISEEDFMKDNSFLNYLKVRGSLGNIYTDNSINDYYLYQSSYTSPGSYSYNDGTQSNRRWRVAVSGNPDLTYAKRTEFQVGFESVMFNSLQVEGGYFYSKLSGDPIQLVNTHPDFLGAVLPYENYNDYQTQGAELAVNYTKKIGEFTVDLGYNMAYSVPKVLKIDEPNNPFEYRKKVGKATDAIFGFVADGLYKANDFSQVSYTGQVFTLNDGVVKSSYGTVQPGDIKYVDQNGDKTIDDNDQVVIGNSTARIQHGIKLNIQYKNFQLFALGTGQTGQSRYFNNDYYQVFGDLKYTDKVLDRYNFTTNTGGTYPRLSSKASSSSNNNKNSTFWLYKSNWFNLQTLQLSYALPKNILKKLNMEKLRIYLRGSNLLTASKIKDNLELNTNSAPQMRYITLGLNATF